MKDSFNRSGLSRFLNSPAGRIFRVAAGLCFIFAGYIFRDHVPGIVSMAWGILPLTAGAFDICYVSMILGGPVSGKRIREIQHNN